LEDREGGVFIPQIHVWQNTLHVFSDDVVFAKDKTGTFQLIVLVDTLEEARRMEIDIASADIDSLSAGLFLASEATYIIHREKAVCGLPNNFVFGMSQTEYDEMGLSPPLQGYDKQRIRKEFPWKKFLVARPDRYTFGTAIALDGLQDIAKRAKQTILGSQIQKDI
jgi:hypothetical protein